MYTKKELLKPKQPIRVGGSFIAVIRNGPHAGKELGPFKCTQDRTKRGKRINDRTVSNGRFFPWKQFEIRKVTPEA